MAGEIGLIIKKRIKQLFSPGGSQMDKKRIINGYVVETRGGFITVKRWAVLDSKEENLLGVYFKFRKAKQACETKDFSGGLAEDIY